MVRQFLDRNKYIQKHKLMTLPLYADVNSVFRVTVTSQSVYNAYLSSTSVAADTRVKQLLCPLHGTHPAAHPAVMPDRHSV